ncbi:hypothetical protein K474DRAFT_1670350 [Panus rudis PR-1116 ss-1]|nr:hypothetical protein K474DRAFT_1670350 [Panus rudis PR-1116 ss-1]
MYLLVLPKSSRASPPLLLLALNTIMLFALPMSARVICPRPSDVRWVVYVSLYSIHT